VAAGTKAPLGGFHVGTGDFAIRTDIEPEGIPTETPLAAIRIETIEDYEKATVRVAELAGHVEDSAQERELEALLAAIMEWDKAHNDATAWR